MNSTDLRFMEGGDKIAPLECVRRYEDVGHETIIRELTQNALDAARELKRDCDLRIEIQQIPTRDLPGIESYKAHLTEECMDQWTGRNQQKYDTALNTLRGHAEEATTVCLMISDNGVGLNADTMEGLIGKGDSMKKESDGGSGGTHGVGHETAFAAGDMNFVMYGGVNRQKGHANRVASGHAVFPTHILKGIRYGGHGYLTHDAHQLTLSGVAIIEKESEVPRLINAELDAIEEQSGTGSVVIIPAFHRFLISGAEECCELICEDIAKHFFVAIDQDRLNVFVYDKIGGGGGKSELDNRDDVDRRLVRVKDEKRRRSATQLVAGARVHEAWKTYKEGTERTLTTSFGPIKVRIRHTPDEVSRICIVRAGMFITDECSLLPRRYFSKKLPFSAVLLFAENPDSTVAADNILRASEDAGHSRINDSIREGAGSKVRELFTEIRDQLLRILDDVPEAESVTPEILPISVHTRHTRSTNTGIKARVVPDSSGKIGEGDERSGKRNGKRKGKKRKDGPRRLQPRIPVRTSVVANGDGEYEVMVATSPQAKVHRNVFLRLALKTGSDGSCESRLQGEELKLECMKSSLEGNRLHGTSGAELHLGDLKSDSLVKLTLKVLDEQWTNASLEAVLYERKSA